MANIDRIVNVQIALRTSAITTLSFSDLLLLGKFTPQAGERVIIITDPDDLFNYGVQSTSNLYKAAQVSFSQIPTIPQLYIGNKDPVGMPAPASSLTAIDPFYMEVGDPTSPDVPLVVTGTGFVPTSKIRFGDIVEQSTRFVSDTQLTINISRRLFTGVDPDISVTVYEPNMGETNAQTFMVVPVGSAPPTRPVPPPLEINNVADLMAVINGENTNWYAFCDTDHVAANVIDYAAWAESAQKLFVTTLSEDDTTTPPTTDSASIAAQLKNGNFFRTAWWWHPDPIQFVDVAITARSFTKYPGGETWANQKLGAVAVTNLNEVVARNIFGKNGNTFEPFRNINITQNGKVAGGEWIDVIRFRDWLCEEVRLRVFEQMIDNRIPYTDHGIGIIRTRIDQALAFGVARGGIAPPELDADENYVPSYTITMPLSQNVSFNNKANRLLQDVYFTARLAGAIHVVEIKGTLTYEALAPV